MQGTADPQEIEARRLAINAKNKAYRDANPDRVKAWNKRYLMEAFAPCVGDGKLGEERQGDARVPGDI